MKIKGLLEGKKTYVTAILGALGAIGGFLVGEVSIGELLQTLVTTATAATIRHGVAKK